MSKKPEKYKWLKAGIYFNAFIQKPEKRPIFRGNPILCTGFHNSMALGTDCENNARKFSFGDFILKETNGSHCKNNGQKIQTASKT
jgi:hypothetical protein